MPNEIRKNGSKTPRILIVDDDPGQRSLLDSFLRSQGFETVLAASGEQALEILRSQEFGMMISDVRMPGMSGLETLRRARQEHSVLPVLLVTAYADIREAVGAMRDGALNYLAKPIDLDELLATVQQATGIAKSAPAQVQRRPATAATRHRQEPADAGGVSRCVADCAFGEPHPDHRRKRRGQGSRWRTSFMPGARARTGRW